MLIIDLYQLTLNLGNISFYFIILQLFPNIIKETYFKSFLLLIIIISIILSPLMNYLWLVLNTGNSNYVFFQGVLLWIGIGLGLIEYASAMMRIYST